MYWWLSMELIMALVTVFLHMASGFSIRGHAGNNNKNNNNYNQYGGNRGGAWSPDVDGIRALAGRLQMSQSLEPAITKPQTHTPVFSPHQEDTDLYLYDTFASLGNDLKDALTPYLTNADNDDYENDIAEENGAIESDENGDDADKDSHDDNGDMISVLSSYPHSDSLARSAENLEISPEFGLVDTPSKRQQGWFTPYGKRTSTTDLGNSNTMNFEGIKSEPKLPDSLMLFSSTSPARELNVKSKNHRLNLALRKNLKQLENDLKIRNIAYDMVKSIIADNDSSPKDISQPHSSVKRQQGWYTAYGKRSSETDPESFL